jgi:hypothetical protein
LRNGLSSFYPSQRVNLSSQNQTKRGTIFPPDEPSRRRKEHTEHTGQALRTTGANNSAARGVRSEVRAVWRVAPLRRMGAAARGEWHRRLAFDVPGPGRRVLLLLLAHEHKLQPCRLTLRENPSLPCVKIFAVRFLSGARQRTSLPCVLYRAHDKEKTHGKP